jgi:hypothetical protein
VKPRLALVAVALAATSACGSGDDSDSREQALRSHLGTLAGARVSCEEESCAVTGELRLSSAYTATLVAAPVIDDALGDPALAGVEAISVTLDDEAKQQVFSLRCEMAKLKRPVTVEALRKACHSIFT